MLYLPDLFDSQSHNIATITKIWMSTLQKSIARVNLLMTIFYTHMAHDSIQPNTCSITSLYPFFIFPVTKGPHLSNTVDIHISELLTSKHP